MTPGQHQAMPRVVDVCADHAAVLALSVLRMLAAGYSTGDVACWDMAYTGAERVLPPVAAGRLVGSLTTLIRAIRASRSAGWSFMPATCCRVTRDEEAILHLIAAARSGNLDTRAAAARAVTVGGSAVHLESAAAIVAAMLDEAADDLPTDAAHSGCPSRRVH